MAEHDPAVLSYSHLSHLPRADNALHTLKKVASMVKPIMRARGWNVKELVEFYPDQQNLLGLNVNRGQKICLRLRYPGDRDQFMPFESVVDTMLHELCHIVHGPHDQKFHALWDQLREEMEGLIMKGYSGEGFLSKGERLGGSSVSPIEARRLARQQAEKRRAQAQAQGSGSGRRLGGSGVAPGRNMRQVIAAAAERRNRTMEGCGTQRLTEREIHDIGDTATKNGFRTQAEEDEANEVPIAQALWELVQEEETKNKPSLSTNRPTGSSATTRRTTTNEAGRGHSPQPTAASGGWVCNLCTLFNKPNFLTCDACGNKRSVYDQKKSPAQSTLGEKRTRDAEVIDLTEDSPRPKTSIASGSGTKAASTRQQRPPEPSISKFWMCPYCGNMMERQWWTCSTCGQMKESSK